jgi:hypothetical protein
MAESHVSFAEALRATAPVAIDWDRVLIPEAHLGSAADDVDQLEAEIDRFIQDRRGVR